MAGTRRTTEMAAREERTGQAHTTEACARGDAALPALHDETEDREPHGVTERTELLGVAFQLGWHPLLLTNSK